MYINSSEIHYLYAQLIDNKNGSRRTWNAFNYDYKDKIIGFYENQRKIDLFKSNVENLKSETHNFELQIKIESTQKPILKNFQELILKSKDKKKISIILEDKSENLWKEYIVDKDIDSAYNTATFFYNLYEECLDITIRSLNNSAYVFIQKNELKKAFNLLNEAKRKLTHDDLDPQDIGMTCLVYYNLGVILIMQKEYSKGLSEFQSIVSYCIDKNKSDYMAIALMLLKLDDENKIILQEIKEDDKNFPEINILDFAKINIKVLQDSGVLN